MDLEEQLEAEFRRFVGEKGESFELAPTANGIALRAANKALSVHRSEFKGTPNDWEIVGILMITYHRCTDRTPQTDAKTQLLLDALHQHANLWKVPVEYGRKPLTEALVEAYVCSAMTQEHTAPRTEGGFTAYGSGSGVDLDTYHEGTLEPMADDLAGESSANTTPRPETLSVGDLSRLTIASLIDTPTTSDIQSASEATMNTTEAATRVEVCSQANGLQHLRYSPAFQFGYVPVTETEYEVRRAGLFFKCPYAWCRSATSSVRSHLMNMHPSDGRWNLIGVNIFHRVYALDRTDSTEVIIWHLVETSCHSETRRWL